MEEQERPKPEAPKPKAKKPVTASAVIQRVRGCSAQEARVVLAATKADEDSVVKAYADGAAAVEAVLNEAHDKAFPPEKDKK